MREDTMPLKVYDHGTNGSVLRFNHNAGKWIARTGASLHKHEYVLPSKRSQRSFCGVGGQTYRFACLACGKRAHVLTAWFWKGKP